MTAKRRSPSASTPAAAELHPRLRQRLADPQGTLARLGVPPRYQHCTRATWEGDWPLRDGAVFVTLLGLPGRGKTHVATARLYELVCADPEIPVDASEQHHTGYSQSQNRALWVPARWAVENQKPNAPDPDGTLKLLCASRALVVDDLGAERMTEFAMDRLTLVLETRYDRMLPTVLTTNLTARAISEMDGRLFSRLFDAGEQAVKLDGDDHRRRKPTTTGDNQGGGK